LALKLAILMVWGAAGRPRLVADSGVGDDDVGGAGRRQAARARRAARAAIVRLTA
jgi:hypothetical protein